MPGANTDGTQGGPGFRACVCMCAPGERLEEAGFPPSPGEEIRSGPPLKSPTPDLDHSFTFNLFKTCVEATL